MAFVCTISPDDEPTIEQNGKAFALTIDIGYDEERERDYKLAVGFDVIPALEDLEFWFHIVEVDWDTGESYELWSGKDTSFIGDDDRALILSLVLSSLKLLLDTSRPTRVKCVTYDPNPPDKALLKYHAIGRTFEQAGYLVKAADPWGGKRCWWMERKP